MGILDALLAGELLQPRRNSEFMPNLGMLGLLPNPDVGTGGEPQFGAGNSFLMPQSGPAAGGDGSDAEAAREAAAGRVRRSVIKPWSPNALAPLPAPWSAPDAPAVAAADPAAAQTPPPLDAPINIESRPQPSIDEIPLPRPRPDNLGVPLSLSPDAALPPNAAPTEGRAAAPDASPGLPPLLAGGKGLLDKIFDPNKAATWLALASGFSGAPSLGTGMRRAFGAAVPAMAADRAQGTKMSAVADTYRALIKAGATPAEALAASQNPEILKQISDKYFDSQLKPTKIGVDMLGNDVMGSFNARTGKYFDAAGREIKAPGTGEGSSTTALGGQPLLAKGVTEYNQDLGPDEYISQFSPEIQAAIKSYASGDTMPTANPRLKGLNQKIKDWAQLWGAKNGQVVSDATFSEKRKFRNELGSVSANTAGGQGKAFNQGIEHMDKLADAILEYKPSNALGIPALAHGVNSLREAFSTNQAGMAAKINGIGQTLAGEVGKLFSGAAGGGVHERELTRQRFESVKSGPELAGALEATIETMEGGLRALEQRRDQALGPNNDVKFVEKETQARIDRIRQVAQALRSGQEMAPHAPAAPAAPSLKPGEVTTINGVTIKRLN